MQVHMCARVRVRVRVCVCARARVCSNRKTRIKTFASVQLVAKGTPNGLIYFYVVWPRTVGVNGLRVSLRAHSSIELTLHRCVAAHMCTNDT